MLRGSPLCTLAMLSKLPRSAGLTPLSPHCVELTRFKQCCDPVVFPCAAKFKPRKITKTAKGKNFDKKSTAATFSVTKSVDCGTMGLTCCDKNDCNHGLKCRSNTCSLDK